jgi:hypothetical protein
MKPIAPPRRFSSVLHFSMTCLPATVSVWTFGICLTAVVQNANASIYSSWDGSSGNWSDAARWSSDPKSPNDGQPVAGDTYSVSISSGTASRNVPITISSLNLSGGVINGASALTVQGATSWSGGRLEDGDVQLNGGLSITSGVRLYGSDLTLAAGQSATVSGSGALSLENQSKVINNGSFFARNSNGITEVGPYQSNFTNNGTFTRDTDSGTFTFGATQFDNAGTLNVNTGTLNVVHGITNSGAIQIATGATLQLNSASEFAAGTSFSGAGQLQVLNNEQNFKLSVFVPNPVSLASAGQISIYNGHTLTLNGALTWSGGTLSRESDFFGGDHGYVNLAGGATIGNGSSFYGLTISNAAASHVTITSGARLWFEGDAYLNNAGTLTLQSQAGLVPKNNTTGNSFSNSGTLVSNGDPLNWTNIDVGLINTGTVNATSGVTILSAGGSNVGTFQAATGAVLSWSDGNYTFNSGTAFTGDGTFQFSGGTQRIDGSLTTGSNLESASDLTLTTGTAVSVNGS